MIKLARLQEIHPAVDGDVIRTWFAGDTEGALHLGSYAEPDQWFKLLSHSRHGWFVINEDRRMGFVDLEVNNQAGYFAYYIAPEYRGKGYGTQTLRLLVERAHQLGLTVLEGGVEPDNAASIAALKRTGFELLALDDEGMLPIRLVIKPR